MRQARANGERINFHHALRPFGSLEREFPEHLFQKCVQAARADVFAIRVDLRGQSRDFVRRVVAPLQIDAIGF